MVPIIESVPIIPEARDNMSIYITMKTKSDKSRVTPDKFLTWAQQDIKGGGKRGIANALTNAKRALHARIDEILYSVRVRYANDWPKWPDKPSTSLKLKVLRRLNITTTAIAKVLTESRNDLEHAYKLPSQEQVQFYVQTARLWLNDSKTYLHPPIVLAGLPIKTCVPSPYVRTKKELTVGSTEKILFFCDAKRKLIILKSDGTQSETSYDKFKWKDMIKNQQTYFYDSNPLIVPSMSIASKIYREYKQLVNRNKRGVIIPFDKIMLEESDVWHGEPK